MQLEFEGRTEIKLSGVGEITLPSYMNLLPKESLAEDAVQGPNRGQYVVAAGLRPNSSTVNLLAGDGALYEFECLDEIEGAVPSCRGRAVCFTLCGFDQVEINADMVIACSQRLTSLAD